MHHALDRRVGTRVEQPARAGDVGLRDLLLGRPVGHERAAVQHVAAAVHGARQRSLARQVADGDLHVQLLQRGGIAALAYQAAHRPSFAGQPAHEAPADEARRAGDQAHVLARAVQAPAAKRRAAAVWRLRHVLGIRELRRSAAQQRRLGDVAYDRPVLARCAMAVGEHCVERVEEALRLLLRQRERRQQLDHVVLAGSHRDHAVVAVQRDDDQLRE